MIIAKPMIKSNKKFYQKQCLWCPEDYFGEVDEASIKKVSIIKKIIHKHSDILDLGAGGGQNAFAMNKLGHNVVAIELLPELAKWAKKIAENKAGLKIITNDFYKVKLKEKFDLITYWDGFGVGEDEDQKKLLKNINSWLKRDGSVLIEIYAPWYFGYFSKREMQIGKVKRQFSFDFVGCRWQDEWQLKGKKIKQSLRCYSPADLKLLLEGTGLVLKKVIPCLGYAKNKEVFLYKEKALSEKTITYLAQILKK